MRERSERVHRSVLSFSKGCRLWDTQPVGCVGQVAWSWHVVGALVDQQNLFGGRQGVWKHCLFWSSLPDRRYIISASLTIKEDVLRVRA